MMNEKMNTLLSGWIYKQKSKKKALVSSWNKRWFTVQVLHGGIGKELVLCYFTKRGAFDPNGWVFLREINHILYANEKGKLPSEVQEENHREVSAVSKVKHGFIVASESRNFFFRCEDATSASMWVEGLRRICALGNGGLWPMSVGPIPMPVPYLVQIAVDKKMYLKYESSLGMLSTTSAAAHHHNNTASDEVSPNNIIDFNQESKCNGGDSTTSVDGIEDRDIITGEGDGGGGFKIEHSPILKENSISEIFATNENTSNGNIIERRSKFIGFQPNCDGKRPQRLNKNHKHQRGVKDIPDSELKSLEDRHYIPVLDMPEPGESERTSTHFPSIFPRKYSSSRIPILDGEELAPMSPKLSIIEKAVRSRRFPDLDGDEENLIHHSIYNPVGSGDRSKDRYQQGDGGGNPGNPGRDSSDCTHRNSPEEAKLSDSFDPSFHKPDEIDGSSPWDAESDEDEDYSKINRKIHRKTPSSDIATPVRNYSYESWDDNDFDSNKKNDEEKSRSIVEDKLIGAGVTTDENWLDDNWDSDEED